MANQEHLDILMQGVEVWNMWREDYPDIRPNLRRADLDSYDLRTANLDRVDFNGTSLAGADLRWASGIEINLSETNLSGTDLSGVNFGEASFMEAQLIGANLSGADLIRVSFSGANLTKANLSRADLTKANLSEANLSEANLSQAKLIEANLSGANLTKANLTGCFIYAISAWDIHLEETIQSGLVITKTKKPGITVDDLEVAQFIYLLLNNEKIRQIIDTITSKMVLILGRFTPERKIVLDAIRDELRKRNYTPVLFDFEKPANRDITETVSTLAHMARFVIADITDAKSIPQELKTIVPNLPSVPVLPLILNSQHEYGMFEHFRRFPWVLPVYRYPNKATLLKSIREHIIEPAEQKAQELAQH